MRRFGFPAGCVFLLLSTARAAADGGPLPESYSLPGYKPHDWSGFYGGVQGGWLGGHFEFHEIETAQRFTTVPELTDNSNSFVAGGLLGLNAQYRNWVYGGEMDIEFTESSASVITPAGNRLKRDLNFFGSIRGRFGYSLDRMLPYVTAGVAFGNEKLEVTPSETPLTRFSDTQTAVGFTAGAGLEFALGENLSAGIEYRYTNLNETLNENPFISANLQFPASNHFSTVQARLVWRFGQ